MPNKLTLSEKLIMQPLKFFAINSALPFLPRLGVFVSAHEASADEQVFVERDMFVLDLVQNIEWLRCSLGQVWDGNTCKGEIMKLNHDEIQQAILQANEQLGRAGDCRHRTN